MDDGEERSREDHQEACIAIAADVVKEFPRDRKHALSEACYSYSELGLWPADLELSEADAITIWSVVEAVRRNGFPDDLRM